MAQKQKIHGNQINVAKTMIGLYWSGSHVLNVISEAQAGKTGLLIALADLWQATIAGKHACAKDMGKYQDYVMDNVGIILQGPSDNSLKAQTKDRFTTYDYDCFNKPLRSFPFKDNIHCIAASDGAKQQEAYQTAGIHKKPFTMWASDESHVYCPLEGKINRNYFKDIDPTKDLLIAVSATPAHSNGQRNHQAVYLKPGEGYWGARDLAKSNRLQPAQNPFFPKKRGVALTVRKDWIDAIVIANLIDPIVGNVNKDLGIIRVKNKTEANLLQQAIENRLKETRSHLKPQDDYVIQIFNSNNRNIPGLIRNGTSMSEPGWLQKSDCNESKNRDGVAKIAIIIKGYGQGATLHAKNRIAFWHDQYRTKKQAKKNNCQIIQSNGRNFGYSIDVDGTMVSLQSLDYPIYTNVKIIKEAAVYYETMDALASTKPGEIGLIEDPLAVPDHWTNSNVKNEEKLKYKPISVSVIGYDASADAKKVHSETGITSAKDNEVNDVVKEANAGNWGRFIKGHKRGVYERIFNWSGLDFVNDHPAIELKDYFLKDHQVDIELTPFVYIEFDQVTETKVIKNKTFAKERM